MFWWWAFGLPERAGRCKIGYRVLICRLLGGFAVGAIYYGAWNPDPHFESYHGKNWSEYTTVIDAIPRWPGHIQPNIPVWQPWNASEATPSGAELRVQAALKAGIDFFLFDSYWYEEVNPPTGGPVMNLALDEGFLKAPSSSKMKFAMMLANQDWVDIVPAKAGWHATGRQSDASVPKDMLLIYDGFLGNATLQAAFEYYTKTYFTLDNYLRIPTLSQGNKDCALFSFYLPSYLMVTFGGAKGAGQVIQSLRAIAAKSGVCLHINAMGQSLPKDPTTVAELGIDSVSNYGFMKTVDTSSSFPVAQYSDVLQAGIKAWSDNEDAWGVPYLPSFSVAWDPSPRCSKTDTYQNYGYPWTTAWRSTPQEFQDGLQQAKAYLDKRCSDSGPGAYCPPLFINAWNEWSESSYLEPDVREGFARLDAVQAVFGN